MKLEQISLQKNLSFKSLGSTERINSTSSTCFPVKHYCIQFTSKSESDNVAS